MYEKILQQIGLNEKEAVVYEILLETGPIKASELLKKASKKIKTTRSNLYNILATLKERNLVTEKNIKGKNTFEPNSPTELLNVFEEKKKRSDQTQKNLAIAMPELKSLYTLTTQKPIVQFFEGAEGIKKVIWDTLSSKETIRTFADAEMVDKHIKDINNAYVRERQKNKITKKIIMVDSPYNRRFMSKYHKKITDTKMINAKLYPFTSIMQIYDNKISYATLSDKYKIGVIIENKSIYEMNKTLFDYIWSHTETIN